MFLANTVGSFRTTTHELSAIWLHLKIQAGQPSYPIVLNGIHMHQGCMEVAKDISHMAAQHVAMV